MLFTKESDYAIRVIRALQDGGKKTIKELCELEQIPSAFGYKILQKMNKSGLIEIRRGPKGGYQLAKDIGEFTLYDVVTAIEPDFAVMECVHHSCIRNERGMCGSQRTSWNSAFGRKAFEKKDNG